MSESAAPFFRMAGVSKRYGGVRALEKADLTCHRGQIQAVLGENGAGKSTLIKIMSGVVQPDEGSMELDGSAIKLPSPAAANAAGIVCIFQELSLMPDLSVADNIAISNPPRRFGMINRRAQRLVAIGLFAVFAVAGLGSIGWMAKHAWAIRQLTRGVGDTTFHAVDGRPWFRMDEQRQDVPLAEVSPHLRDAVIAVEDHRF